MTLEEAWQHRPIYKLTGIPRSEFKEILKDPEKLADFKKLLNLMKQI